MRSPVNEIRMVLSKNPCMHIHLILFFFQSKDRNKLISQFVKYLTTKGQQTLKLRFLRLIIFINLFFCGNIKIECIQVLSGWSNIIYIRSICKDLLRNLANIENNNWRLLIKDIWQSTRYTSGLPRIFRGLGVRVYRPVKWLVFENVFLREAWKLLSQN